MLAALLLSLAPNLNTYIPAPKRKRDDLPCSVQGEALWIKDIAQLGYWVKHESKWYPIELYNYMHTDKQQRIHTGHAWFILLEDNNDGTWHTRGANMVNITNDLELGWWDVVDPNHQTGQHVITAPEPAQISAAPSAGPVSMDTIAATMVAPVQSAQSNGQRKGGLIGLPPPIFDGNRAKSNPFLDKFLGYELLNRESRTFQVPYLKTALCLSYIIGPNVDAWANAKRRWLRDQVKVHGVPQSSDMLWGSFEHDFRAAYIDSDAKLNALQKFQELKMIGGDIDSYIATFD
jgi:hypothetical protein